MQAGKKKKGPRQSKGLGGPGAGSLARKALFLVRHGHERPGIAYGAALLPHSGGDMPPAVCRLQAAFPADGPSGMMRAISAMQSSSGTASEQVQACSYAPRVLPRNERRHSRF